MTKPISTPLINRREAGLALVAGIVFPALARAQSAPYPPAPVVPAPAAPVPAVSPASSASKLLPVRTLTAAPAKAPLRPSHQPLVNVWAFDGQSPAPVLRAKQGETLQIKLDNKTDQPLSLHWHGIRQAAADDGVGGFSNTSVPPGGSGVFKVFLPDAGTFLYRPMIIGGSAQPLERGLSGFIIVDEPIAPQIDQEVLLLVDDWLLGDDGQIAVFPVDAPVAATAGRLGNWLTTNGKPLPDRTSVRPGARVRVRIANVSNARTFRIRFDNLSPFVAAIDGQPTDTFEPLRATLPLAPGSRYDLLIDMPEQEGQSGSITALVGPGVPLAQLSTSGKPMKETRAALPPIGPLPPNRELPPGIRLQDSVRAEIVIEGGARISTDNKLDLTGIDLKKPWTINGKVGDVGGKPFVTAQIGQPVVLTIHNRTAFSQPFHLHGHVMRLLHPLDDGWEPYFLDTLIIPDNKTVRIAFQAAQAGKWMLSSSVAERFDSGLWTWFQVNEAASK
jgi:FtsP/CotA-like multicopper oxidase with cupredoxin domain